MSAKLSAADSDSAEWSLPSSLLLAYVIASSDRAGNVDRLGPALYLAQLKVGKRIYAYRLAMGHVVSDELAQDIAQLSAAGVLEWADEAHVRLVDTFRSALSLKLRNAQQLGDAIASFIGEEETTLDAAATRTFFAVEGVGDPAARLNWFRTLPGDVAKRAGEVAGSVEGMIR